MQHSSPGSAGLDASVIVVGAGPAGLMLAGELALGGADVLLLERLAAPTGESRGLGFTARTLEVFDQRGLLPRLGDVQITDLGHFGGLPIDFSLLGVPHAGGVKGIPQARTEQMLGDWIAELGVSVRREHTLTALHDDGDSVRLTVQTPDGPITLRCAYLVGCDGGRSIVRKLGGFDFPGTPATLEMYLADVQGVEIESRMIGQTLPGGMVMAGPLDAQTTRIIVCERGTKPRTGDRPVSWAEIASAWQRLTGQDISHGRAGWLSAFGDAARLVTEYRRGRVLLAGDAAHVHLPAGGQGMNTSIQDAVNLGWKLAAVAAGRAMPELLASYHDERYPVGARLLLNTRAQGLVFLSGEEIQPLRDVLGELIEFEDVSRHLAGLVSGLAIRYGLGDGDHPLLGLRMPDVELVGEAGKTSVMQLLHPARGVLLDLADDVELRAAARPWTGVVHLITAEPHDPADAPMLRDGALLIRPDGHVAWTSSGPEPIEAALTRWFGPNPAA